MLDTGSPTSFHATGFIKWAGVKIPVCSSVNGVSKDYLSTNVGRNIDGLVGMDIIHRFPLLISLRDNQLFIDDDANYSRSFKQIELGPFAQGLIAIEMLVNNRVVRMIVDTGAPISYINKTFVEGLVFEREVTDFHPLIGSFKTHTYRCKVNHINEDAPYYQEFGILPNLIESTLSMLHIDGIIGVELFKRYRIQIKNGQLFLPPQGI